MGKDGILTSQEPVLMGSTTGSAPSDEECNGRTKTDNAQRSATNSTDNAIQIPKGEWISPFTCENP